MVETDRAMNSPIVQASDQSAATVNSKAFFSGGTYNNMYEQRKGSYPGEMHEVSPGGGREARENQ